MATLLADAYYTVNDPNDSSDGAFMSDAGSGNSDSENEVFTPEMEDLAGKHQVEVNSQDDARSVYHVARILRNLCIDHQPPGSNAISHPAELSIPPLLFNFLVWVYSDRFHDEILGSRLKIDGDLHRVVVSTGQDIMYASSKIVPPKHIVLALTIHHLLRSKKLITVLNRYGHCIAYPQVQEWETGKPTID